MSWQDLNFDFTGVVFDGSDFTLANFSGRVVDFTGAEFSGGEVDFTGAKFSDGTVNFNGAKFSGGTVNFSPVLGPADDKQSTINETIQ